MRTFFESKNVDFTCRHCGRFVSANRALSGVAHRNHCPICLFSRHVDLFEAGDRLCACKGLMAPIGLTFKQSRDKYTPEGRGELMLVHRCQACGAFSINRIAADDAPHSLWEAFADSHEVDSGVLSRCRQNGIRMLCTADASLVWARLFGPAERVTRTTAPASS
jgi:hypothetical protein